MRNLMQTIQDTWKVSPRLTAHVLGYTVAIWIFDAFDSLLNLFLRRPSRAGTFRDEVSRLTYETLHRLNSVCSLLHLTGGMTMKSSANGRRREEWCP